MACSKVRKEDYEIREFKDEWMHKYAFILRVNATRPVCLICYEPVAIIKSGNVKRHYDTKHKNFEETYPQQSEVRTTKINELTAQYDRSTKVITQSFTAQQRAHECSLRVQWILAQHKKPFTDGGIVKDCMNAVAETLLDGKQRELLEKIK